MIETRKNNTQPLRLKGGGVVSLLRFLLKRIRDLGQNHSGKHDDAADVLPGRHLLVQDDSAGDNGKHALEAEKDGDHRGVGILLCQNLQRIGHAGGEHTYIQDRQETGQDALPVRHGKNGGGDGNVTNAVDAEDGADHLGNGRPHGRHL